MDLDPFADLTAERLREFQAITLEYGSYAAPPNDQRPYTFHVTEPGHAFDYICGPLHLHVSTAPTYPAFPPSYTVKVAGEADGTCDNGETTSMGVSKLKMAEIEARLNTIANEKRGEVFLRDLIEEVRLFSEDLCEEPAVVPDDDEDYIDQPVISNIQHWLDRQLVNNIERLDSTTAQSYMGKTTLQSIIDGLPPSLRLLHAEVVLRAPLVRRFNEAREKLIKKYAKEVERRGGSRRAQDAAVDKLTQVDVVFHGTLRRHVGSIVQSGFVIPGKKTNTGEEVKVRCGSTFGVGTYTSPRLTYCLSYADTTAKSPKLLPGQKVIVCAALMGRRYEMRRSESQFRRNPEVAQGYDSHVSPSQLEWVIFNPEHLLPLYVLHLEDSTSNRPAWNAPAPTISSSTSRPLDPSSNLSGASADISLVERRKLLTAQARKHFPYGFGAASGSKFVVEEIAPVDDDEEEWGEYQEDRFGEFLEEIDGVGEFQRMRLK
ncbi:hypothetical protein FRC04_003744 [Tulasnella sp. 424]|nr:hypothetical protein FRC04_003744 [Tulasnella sp. 424]KAG8977073.1 hypothetical protein FRC05_002594 [Tulasnella sp. 425]